MPAMGILLVLRGRKQHQCAECNQTVEVGEWHTALVGKTKLSGKHFTTRLHQRCLWLRIGTVMASPRTAARVQRGRPLAALDSEQRTLRHKLVMLRAYHRRCKHVKRVVELDTLIEATGVAAPHRDGRRQALAKGPVVDEGFRAIYLERLKALTVRYKSWKRAPQSEKDWFIEWQGEAGQSGFATVEDALQHLKENK